jgi:putative FmdB family regulatory protein
MPTYEYVCSDCQNAWEEVQKISELPLVECPRCHKPTAKRQISGGNFILKGGGWYADLYSSAKPPAKKDEAPAASSSTGNEGKGDAKPTATKESAPAAAPSPTSPGTPSKD